jgi:hypothetical protein
MQGAMNRTFRVNFMKRSKIIKISSIAVTLVILLVIVVLLRSQPQQTPVPAFKFLSGRAPTARIEVKKYSYRLSRFGYSFEADFNDIAADANSELSALGYVNNTHIDSYYPSVKYFIPGTQASIMENSIQIVKNCTLRFISPRDGDNLIFPDQYVSLGKDGWVIVEIVQSKKQSWFVANMNYFFNKLRGLE